MSDRPIVFFDGVCNLCNSFIDFIIKRDKNSLLFASLQGETAQEKLNSKMKFIKNQTQNDIKNLKTIVLLENDQIYVKSEAVLRIFAKLKWPWKIIWIFHFLPQVLLDFLYDYFSSHRYQWFGKKNTCRLPSPQERLRLLD